MNLGFARKAFEMKTLVNPKLKLTLVVCGIICLSAIALM